MYRTKPPLWVTVFLYQSVNILQKILLYVEFEQNYSVIVITAVNQHLLCD
jgi:hypothetical protein